MVCVVEIGTGVLLVLNVCVVEIGTGVLLVLNVCVVEIGMVCVVKIGMVCVVRYEWCASLKSQRSGLLNWNGWNGCD